MQLKVKYEEALKDYFDTLDELDEIHCAKFKTIKRRKLKKQLKEQSEKCIEIETQIADIFQPYIKRRTDLDF